MTLAFAFGIAVNQQETVIARAQNKENIGQTKPSIGR